MLFLIEDIMRTRPMYTLRPWICICLGLLTFALGGSSILAAGFGIMLLVCGFSIFYLRLTYKGAPVNAQE